MACLFVSHTYGATALVEKYDRYRREAYNAKVLNEVVPGYTIKLKNIFRNEPAKRQAVLQEKETILKAVIATALIHDDKITLFDPADDTVPEFDSNNGSVRSHFQILWHAEHFARNSIRKVLARYNSELSNKYAKTEDDAEIARIPEETRQSINARLIINSGEPSDDLRQLERLSGIRADDFTRWVSEVYNQYSTGLYMDGTNWRTSSEYDPTYLEFYESTADEHYRHSAVENDRKSTRAYTRPDSRSASAASASASESATPSTVEKVILHDKEFDYAEIYRVYKRKRNAREDMFKSMSAAVPYDDRFKNRFVDVPRPMPEGYGSLSHKSDSYNKERSMLRQKLEYDYLEQTG